MTKSGKQRPGSSSNQWSCNTSRTLRYITRSNKYIFHQHMSPYFIIEYNDGFPTVPCREEVLRLISFLGRYILPIPNPKSPQVAPLPCSHISERDPMTLSITEHLCSVSTKKCISPPSRLAASIPPFHQTPPTSLPSKHNNITKSNLDPCTPQHRRTVNRKEKEGRHG